MRVSIGCVCAFACGWVGVAHSQGDPDQAPVLPSGGTLGGASPSAPTVAEPPPPAPVASPPAPGVQSDWRTRSVDRRGPAVLGGLSIGDEARWRLDANMPVVVAKAPALRVGLVMLYDHQAEAIPELAVDVYSFAAFPTVLYDWKLPIRSGGGDFVASIEGGLGYAFARIKVDVPFMPGRFENTSGLAFRMAPAFQFRARAGWIVSFQPLGMIAPVGDADVPESVMQNFEVKRETKLELAFMAGYQF